MAKTDLLRRNDQRPPTANGELVPVASVVQISNLTVQGPYTGDFQITNGGRLIVGNNPETGQRIIVSNSGMFGYSANGTNTFSLYGSTVGNYAPGDLHLGNLAANYLLYQQATGTLGLYTPQGAGFIARRDGTLQAGQATGAHMLWDAGEGALQVRYGSDIKINLGSDGNATFDGTVYANGGRIYGEMVVDDRLRVGDVDGPAVYVGKFSREASGETIETSEIIATDEHNLPWFHVVAGGETLPGYFHLGGTGQYAGYLDFDGTTVTHDGTLISARGRFVADASGVSFTQSAGAYWRVQPSASLFMELVSSATENYNTLRVTEDVGIAGYFSGGYIGLYARSTTDQIGIFGYAGSDTTAGSTPAVETLDPDMTDGIEALGPGVSVYGLAEDGTAGRFIATDGGRGVVGSTNSGTYAGVVARNTGGGPALVLESSYMDAAGQSIVNIAGLRIDEVSTPSAVADHAVLYAEDKSGKTALMVRFPTGAAIQIAIEA